MAELSPAARAIRHAVMETYGPCVPRDDRTWWLDREQVVAVLRTLADHPQEPITLGQPIDHWSPDARTRQELRNLAEELEGVSSTSSTHYK